MFSSLNTKEWSDQNINNSLMFRPEKRKEKLLYNTFSKFHKGNQVIYMFLCLFQRGDEKMIILTKLKGPQVDENLKGAPNRGLETSWGTLSRLKTTEGSTISSLTIS